MIDLWIEKTLSSSARTRGDTSETARQMSGAERLAVVCDRQLPHSQFASFDPTQSDAILLTGRAPTKELRSSP